MNRVLIEAWVEDLESGKYAQGTEMLVIEVYDEHLIPTGEFEYCCLGVLKEKTAVKLGLELADDGENTLICDSDWYAILGKEQEKIENKARNKLYELVVKDDRLDSTDPETSQAVLASLNDHNFSFQEIADFIKETML